MPNQNIPFDRVLTDAELHALICRMILRLDARERGHVNPSQLIRLDLIGRDSNLSGESLTRFVQLNSSLHGPRKISEFIGRLIRMGMLYRDWDQSSSTFHYVSEYGRPLLSDIASLAQFEATEFVQTLQDVELRERCQDVLMRTQMFDSMVRDAIAVLETRLRNLPHIEASHRRRDLAVSALSPRAGAYVLGEDEGQQESAQLLYQGILGFFGNPFLHGLRDIEPIRARQIVGFIDTLLHLLSQIERRLGT